MFEEYKYIAALQAWYEGKIAVLLDVLSTMSL